MINNYNLKWIVTCSILLIFSCIQHKNEKSKPIPQLVDKNGITQLYVDGKPFLILDGELGNSSASSMEYMEAIWEILTVQHLNTVLVPVYWELVEPEEGLFDFTLVDEIVCKAREHDLRIIFLWFGAWKNSISCYAPPWIKKDDSLFPLTMTSTGETIEILSPFSSETCNADTRAFSTLMKHIREIDEQERTVIMVQIENEIGMIPDARDYSPMANQAFDENVPKELLDYLIDNELNLIPEFRQFWLDNGKKVQGTWEEVFGNSVSTDEVFMAWYYAKYVNQLASAGKQKYPHTHVCECSAIS